MRILLLTSAVASLVPCNPLADSCGTILSKLITGIDDVDYGKNCYQLIQRYCYCKPRDACQVLRQKRRHVGFQYRKFRDPIARMIVNHTNVYLQQECFKLQVAKKCTRTQPVVIT